MNKHVHYLVEWDEVLDTIRSIKVRVQAGGVDGRQRFLAALRTLEHELARSPLQWGEAKYTLKDSMQIVCVAFSNRYRVEYGVSMSEKKVYVREFGDSFE